MQNHNCCFLNQYPLIFFLPASHDRKLKILNTLEKTVNIKEFTKVRNEIRIFGSECAVYHEVSAFPWGQPRGGLPFSSIPGNGMYLDISHSISILCSHTSTLASCRELFCFPQSLCCSLGSYSWSSGF